MLVNFDYSRLKGRIVEFYGSQEAFAKVIGVTGKTISKKMNNRCPFRDTEIMRWCDLLGIAEEDILSYFFKPKVQEVELKEIKEDL